MAESLAKSAVNYHTIITSRSLPKGESALASLRSANPDASFSLLQLDVTDDKSIEAAAESVTKEFGVLDVLINNAGTVSSGTSLREKLRSSFETNTFGAAVVT